MKLPCPVSDRDTSALRHKPPEGPLRIVLTGRRGATLSVGFAAGMMLAMAKRGSAPSALSASVSGEHGVMINQFGSS